MCCAWAIVIGKAKADDHPKWETVRVSIPTQTRLATGLCLAAEVDHAKPCGHDELQKFQAHLTDYQISVVCKELMFGFYYMGDYKEKHINLILGEDHYHTITTMTGFFGTNYYCHHCKTGYSETHNCNLKCGLCQDIECKNFPKLEQYKVCDDCNVYFKNETCFNSHKKVFTGSLSRCDKFYRCKDCCKILSVKKHPKDNHNCGDYICGTCRHVVQPGHLCYMQKAGKEKDDEQTGTGKGKGKGKKKKEPEFRLLFFYFESMTVDRKIVDVYDKEYSYQKKT